MSKTTKTFTVVEKRELIEFVTYTVEAESEEEALTLVEDGEIEDNDDHWTKDTGVISYEIRK
jgi:hypothetical protein